MLTLCSSGAFLFFPLYISRDLCFISFWEATDLFVSPPLTKTPVSDATLWHGVFSPHELLTPYYTSGSPFPFFDRFAKIFSVSLMVDAQYVLPSSIRFGALRVCRFSCERKLFYGGSTSCNRYYSPSPLFPSHRHSDSAGFPSSNLIHDPFSYFFDR